HGFRYYFTPLPGYFSPFPHGTDSLSVNRKYLGLPGGPGRFTRDSTNLVLLGEHTTATTPVSTTGLSPSTVRHPHLFVYQHHPPPCTAAQHLRTQPPAPRSPCRVSHVIGLASSAFARHS